METELSILANSVDVRRVRAEKTNGNWHRVDVQSICVGGIDGFSPLAAFQEH